MKLKYYMRGLGIGIILTTLILTIGNHTLSDEEVIRRANALGMSFKDEEEDKLSEVLGNGEAAQKVTPVVTLTLTPSPTSPNQPASELTPTSAPTQVAAPTPTLAPATEPEPTEASKPTTVAQTTAAGKPSDAEQPVSGSKISFSIKRGMGSGEVARLLVQAGLIKDAVDFNGYIVKLGQASNIKVGTFKIKKDASYDEIIEQIILK